MSRSRTPGPVRQYRTNPLTWSGDRLTREGVNAAAMVLDVIEGKDPTTGAVVRPPVRFVSHDGLDSADGDGFRWRFVIAAEVGRAERERMVTRARARTRRLREAGRFMGGVAPFGARRTRRKDGTYLEPDPDEIALLRAAGARLLGGESLADVARWLSGRSRTRRGKPWSAGGLAQTLTTDFALAEVWSPDEGAALLGRLRGQATKNGRQHKATGTGRARGSALLSGLAFCASCGSRLRVSAKAGGVPVYRCWATSDGRSCPRPVHVGLRLADERVGEMLVEAGGEFPIVERRPVIDAGNDGERAALESEKRDALAALGQAATPENFARLQAVSERLDAVPVVPTTVRWEEVDTGLTLADVWPTLPDVERGPMLEKAGLRFVVFPPALPRRFDPERIQAFHFHGTPSPEEVLTLVGVAKALGSLQIAPVTAGEAPGE